MNMKLTYSTNLNLIVYADAQSNFTITIKLKDSVDCFAYLFYHKLIRQCKNGGICVNGVC